MKKLLTIIALVLFIGCGMASAKDPEYEVTIHIVYNSISVHEIANLMRDQLREHKDACKVEVKIKSLDEVSFINRDDAAIGTILWSGDVTSTTLEVRD